MAVDETSKNTIYAAEDRMAARAEFQSLKTMYETALTEGGGDVAKEISMRVGGRIRELEAGIKRLEEEGGERRDGE